MCLLKLRCLVLAVFRGEPIECEGRIGSVDLILSSSWNEDLKLLWRELPQSFGVTDLSDKRGLRTPSEGKGCPSILYPDLFWGGEARQKSSFLVGCAIVKVRTRSARESAASSTFFHSIT